MRALERSLLGLYGGAWLALLAVCALCLWCGRTLPLLPGSGGHGVSLYLGLWLTVGLLLAAMTRSDRAWRAVLFASAAGLFVNAALVMRSNGVLAWPLALSLVLLALPCLPLAHLFDAGRIRKPRRSAQRRVGRRRKRRVDLQLAWSAWVVALLSSFYGAWKPANADVRGAAMATLLLVLFLALPAVCAGAWRRRGAAIGVGLVFGAAAALYQPSMQLALSLASLAVAATAFALPLERITGRASQAQC